MEGENLSGRKLIKTRGFVKGNLANGKTMSTAVEDPSP